MDSVKTVKERFQAADHESLPVLISEYSEDERPGVKALVERGIRRLHLIEEEEARIDGMRRFETAAAGDYLTTGLLCGIDEAGRGPLAGPVAAGAVIMPTDSDLLFINDSKKLTPAKRDELFEKIRENAVSYAVALVSPARIDEINILQATYEAMRAAVSELDPAPEVLINDAVRIPGIHLPQVPVIKGDAKCYSVAAASILAKVTRDRIMTEMDRAYPEYGFAGNKGYGSADHIEALKKYGPCPIHRRSFIGNFCSLSGLGPAEDLPGGVTVIGVGKKKNERTLGTEKELLAAEYLKEQGLKILEHSFRCRIGEIDLVAEENEGRTVFAEVKYRSGTTKGSAEEAVDQRKQQTIRMAAAYYMKKHGLPENAPVRFDVIAINGDRINWIRNAF